MINKDVLKSARGTYPLWASEVNCWEQIHPPLALNTHIFQRYHDDNKNRPVAVSVQGDPERRQKKKAAEEILCLRMKWEAPPFERGSLGYG